VIEGKRGQLAGAQAVGDEQEQNRVVALASRHAPLDHREHSSHFLPGDRTGNLREPVDMRSIDCAAYVLGQQLFAVKIAKKDAQYAAHVANSGLAKPRTAVSNESRQNRRRQIAQIMEVDLV